MPYIVNLPHLLLLQNLELMLLTLIISRLVRRGFNLQKNVVTINSNFTHKAFDGYKQFISKPKIKCIRKIDGPDKASSGRLSLLLSLIMKKILKLPDTFLSLVLYKYLVLFF